ncbi:MAG TPA: hypothetical protein G4N92_09530 [Anaerolineae bacterium]|nr:hypothetical protein [Anaerolineae bacterium]
MSNTIGLFLIATGILLIIAFVITVGYFAKNKPNTRLGKICKKIDSFIDNLPED